MLKRIGLATTLAFLVSCSGTPQDPRGAGDEAAAADTATGMVASGGADLVVHVAGRSFVVLDNEVTEGMGVGAPTLVANESELVTATRALDPSRIPAALITARASTVTVVSDSGARCEARVSDVVLLAQISPDRKLETADEVFQLGELGAHIALALDLPRERCTGAHYALVSGDAETARPLPANEAMSETVLAAFRALPEAQGYAKMYDDYFAGRSEAEDAANGVVRGTSWDTYLGQAPSVHRFALGNESLLFVTAGVDDGCGGLSTQLSVLFRETAGGPVVVRTWEDFSREPLAIVSAPGGYDVIFQDIRGRTTEPTLMNAEPQVHGCRC